MLQLSTGPFVLRLKKGLQLIVVKDSKKVDTQIDDDG
jgi:hypothetical protein